MAQTPLLSYLAQLADPATLDSFREDPAGHAARAGLSEELSALVLAGHRGALRVRGIKELEEAGLAPVVSDKFGGGGDAGGGGQQAMFTTSSVSNVTTNNFNTTDITISTSVSTVNFTNVSTVNSVTSETVSDSASRAEVGTDTDGATARQGLIDAIDDIIAYFESPEPDVAGQLIVVGSGIRAITDLTLGAEAEIRAAEKVFYCVADPVTERRLHEFNASAESLYGLYGNDRPRIDTYRAMVEAILAPVREGRRVCAVYYGHPGVFAWPTHEAIRVARQEGHRAEMRTGISAEDALFADLGIDPSRPGCQSLEATDFLIRRRVPDTSGHLLLWQAECVGDEGFDFSGYRRHNFGILVEELQRFYPEDHPVVVYEAAQLPHLKPTIKRCSLAKITKDDLSGISTLYLPPARVTPLDREMCRRLGLMV